MWTWIAQLGVMAVESYLKNQSADAETMQRFYDFIGSVGLRQSSTVKLRQDYIDQLKDTDHDDSAGAGGSSI